MRSMEVADKPARDDGNKNKVKLQLLPSTFDDDGNFSKRQHLTSFVIDDLVAFDAGSLAMATSLKQKAAIRDVVLTHAHLDHIAGLPLFIDDLFATLTEPVRIHASAEVIEVLERDIFNWSVYPRFSELKNANGPVMEYCEFESERSFRVEHLTVTPIPVNHKVPAMGFLISDGSSSIALTGDTAVADEFRRAVMEVKDLAAVLVECAFPDELAELAETSYHLTPSKLRSEMRRGEVPDCPIYVINLKPMYRGRIIEQLSKLLPELIVLEVGKEYHF